MKDRCICGKTHCKKCGSTVKGHDCVIVLRGKQAIDYAYKEKMEKEFQSSWITKMFKGK